MFQTFDIIRQASWLKARFLIETRREDTARLLIEFLEESFFNVIIINRIVETNMEIKDYRMELRD